MAIPRAMSKRPGPQPPLEVSHYDCAEEDCTQYLVVPFELITQLSDVPGDPGSQLPYQEFPPYYLAPI